MHKIKAMSHLLIFQLPIFTISLSLHTIILHFLQLTPKTLKEEKQNQKGKGSKGSYMTEVAAGSAFIPRHHHHHLPLGSGKWKDQLVKPNRQCLVVTQPKWQPVIKNQMVKPSTYTSRISTDLPLLESPGALFDEYLEDKPRVFKAIFPDKRRSQRINEEEWRIQMLPIQFLFLTVWPVIDMRLRCKSGGKDYPPGIPRNITKVLDLNIIRWELQGLDDLLKPSHFSLGVNGALYPERQGMRSRLKGQLEMSISFVLPPMLALVPEDGLRSIAESVLKRLVENMKHKVNGSLLADYNEFRKQKTKNLV